MRVENLRKERRKRILIWKKMWNPLSVTLRSDMLEGCDVK
jgi:hypothetical protein